MSSFSPAARSGVAAGLKAAIPMSAASFPFGLVYGVAVAASSIDKWVGAAASWMVLAGAAQLSMLDLIESHASWIVVVTAGLVINLRFALYSAALAPAFKAFPAPWRLVLPYFMTDQAAALALRYFAEHEDPVARRWYYLSASAGIAAFWWIGTILGITVGGAIPAGVDIGFAVPLVFVVLIAPAIVDRPAVAAAMAGAVVTVATVSLPHGLNVILGAGAGIALATAVDSLGRR